MVAITHVSSFTRTVGMQNLTWHDAKHKMEDCGKHLSSWSYDNILFSGWSTCDHCCRNKMMISLSHSFSRTLDMLVHFGSLKWGHPFQLFSIAVAWIFWGWSFRRAFDWQFWKPSLPFGLNFIWIPINYHFISTRLDIFLDSMIKTKIINEWFSQSHV